MTKQNVAETEGLGEAMNRTEFFFEQNGRKFIYIFVGLLVLAALEAQARFEAETPDFKLALEGDANGAGFLDVIEQYGSTPSGNLAKHYAGICYLRTGDLANAAAYLAKYKPVKGIPGAIVNAQNYGLQGDVAVEQQNYAQAVSFYKKAVEAADNNWPAPMYQRKAGLAEQAQGNNAAAAALYEKILYTYPASVEAREAEKLLGSVNNK